jgi:hypothetical protein
MLLLELTTDKLQAITSSAATLDVHVSYSINTAGVITFAKQNTAISSATTTDILAVPAASTVRNANFINIRNKDASLSCDVTVQFNANATLYELFKTTLAAGQVCSFTEGIGWFTYTATPILDMVKYVTTDSVHATAATFADITGLTFPVISGRNYAYQAWLIAVTNLSTTGAQFGIGGVAMTYMDLGGVSPLLAGDGTTAGTYTQGRATAINTAFGAQTTGAATNQLHWMAGGFTPSASGTFAIRATSEVTVAAGLTVRKGSWAWVRQTDN